MFYGAPPPKKALYNLQIGQKLLTSLLEKCICIVNGPKSIALPSDFYNRGCQTWMCVRITWELAKITETQTLFCFNKPEILYTLLAFWVTLLCIKVWEPLFYKALSILTEL